MKTIWKFPLQVQDVQQLSPGAPPGCGYPTCDCGDITQCKATRVPPNAVGQFFHRLNDDAEAQADIEAEGDPENGDVGSVG